MVVLVLIDTLKMIMHIQNKKRMCQNSHKLKITLVTDSCSEGDFVEERVLTHPQTTKFK